MRKSVAPSPRAVAVTCTPLSTGENRDYVRLSFLSTSIVYEQDVDMIYGLYYTNCTDNGAYLHDTEVDYLTTNLLVAKNFANF